MSFDISNTDKLSIFADDMRRLGVTCLAPDINLSEADFSVEPHRDGLAVRYALGALKSVGEGAMETLCGERTANGNFASIDDFADRIGGRLLNRRQLESLSAAGAFDAIEPSRSSVFQAAETILSVANQAESARTTGQGGLFGGVDDDAMVAVQLPIVAIWSMAERMTKEKDAFGFYFSAHPVDRFRHLADAHKAKSFAELCAYPAAVDGARTMAMMAGLVEDVRWRTSAKGRRYSMATISDASGQFIASCFEDGVCAELEEAANSGACGLLTVELDRKAGEEVPRVTLKRIQPFDRLASSTRMRVEVEIADMTALPLLAARLGDTHGGRGELIALLPIEGGQARLRLGRDFVLDSEVAARIETVPGIASVTLSAADAPRLMAVG